MNKLLSITAAVHHCQAPIVKAERLRSSRGLAQYRSSVHPVPMRRIDEDRCLRVTQGKFAPNLRHRSLGFSQRLLSDDVLHSPGACPSGACALARGLEASVTVSMILDSSLTGVGRIGALPFFGPYIIKEYKSRWNAFFCQERKESE